MLRTRTLALGAALFLAAGAPALAHAQATAAPQVARRADDRDDDRDDKGMGSKKLLKGIDLTDAQKSQLKTLHEQQRAETRALRATWNGKPTDAQRQELAALEQKHAQAARAILTPSQQATFDQNLARRKDHAEDRRERRQAKRERRQERRAGQPKAAKP